MCKFNKNSHVSGRDFYRRVRRAKKRLMNTRIPLPQPRSAKKAKGVVRNKIQSGELRVGDKIAPKTFISTTINKDGSIVEISKTVHGNKIPLKEILLRENERLDKAGVLRIETDEFYKTLTEVEIHNKIKKLHEEKNLEHLSLDEKREHLKQIERTRHVKVWHDHSDILGHSYVNFMVSYLYDAANFLTNEEFQEKNPSQTPDVQRMVERPQLYILGQSGTYMSRIK